MTNGIDLAIEAAGCSNRCRHCYASGMPYKPMVLAQYIDILSSFRRVCDQRGLKFYPYPMHDVSTHPNMAEVIQVTVEHSDDGIGAFQPLVTPGNSLALRDELGVVLQKLEKQGINAFWLTIHGRVEDHDWTTSRERSYQRTMQMISTLHSSGYSVGANYMINKRNVRYFSNHAAELKQVGLSQMACEIAGYGFSPNFADKYFAYLPKLADVLPIKDAIVRESDFYKEKWEKLSCMTEGHYLSDLDGYETQEWEALETRAASTLTLVCDRNLNIYIGEAGTYFDLLGKAVDTPTESIIEAAVARGVSCLEKYYFEQHADREIHELARLHGDKTGSRLYWTYEGLRMRWLEVDLKGAHN